MTLIDFKAKQKQHFDALILEVKNNPQKYLAFDSIADVYQADWLKELPMIYTWYVSGLDDGGEEFALSLSFCDRQVVFYPYSNEYQHK